MLSVIIILKLFQPMWGTLTLFLGSINTSPSNTFSPSRIPSSLLLNNISRPRQIPSIGIPSFTAVFSITASFCIELIALSKLPTPGKTSPSYFSKPSKVRMMSTVCAPFLRSDWCRLNKLPAPKSKIAHPCHLHHVFSTWESFPPWVNSCSISKCNGKTLDGRFQFVMIVFSIFYQYVRTGDEILQ